MDPVPTNGTPSVEVPENATRRRFTAEYKQRIVDQYERLPHGERGALLRREGLYSSHIDAWRKLRDQGARSALSRKRGRKPKPELAEAKENARLRRQVAQLERKLKRAHVIIEVQKKVAQALKELEDESAEQNESES
jgi:transposase-like protein